jgi:uncharacterized protein (TIGR02118 family)
MIKLVAFLSFSPNLSRDAAKAYYESRHVPLIRAVMPHIARYQRNFLAQRLGDVDVVTELWFADQAHFDAAMAAVEAPEIARLIAEDEEKFLDRRFNRACIVDERR